MQGCVSAVSRINSLNIIMDMHVIVILIKDTKDVLAASNNTSQFVLRSSFGVYFYQVYRRTFGKYS